MKHWEDLAWQVQDDTERVLLERAIWLREINRCQKSVPGWRSGFELRGKRQDRARGRFENVSIQPAAGDDGIAIGCAYYGHLAIQKKSSRYVMQQAYLGTSYSDNEVEAAAKQWLVRTRTSNGADGSICRETARS